MINRIVRLSFDPSKVDAFEDIFESSKQLISGFEGCRGLSLLRDVHHANVYFTYSLWDSQQHLDAYRHSALFETTWAQTKALFNDRPQAWSTMVIEKVK